MDALAIQSDSGCPSAAVVQAEVRELTTFEQRAAVPPGFQVMLSDRGDHIAIAIVRDGKTSVRIYQDAARDCPRRGHFASVLVAIALMPPDIEQPPVADQPPSRRVRPPRERTPIAPTPLAVPTPVPIRDKLVRIELGARGEVGAPIADSVRIASVGGALGVALGAGRARFTLATAYTPSTELRFTAQTPGSAELQRLEVALGLRLMLTRAPLGTSIDLAGLATRSQLRGLSAHRPAQDTAFGLGWRAGVGFRWAEQRLLGPFLQAHVSVFPGAPALSEPPHGTVGHLPYVWLGLSAGVSLAL